MSNEKISREKFYEYINYLEEVENYVPTRGDGVFFTDGTNMGNFLWNHMVLIKRWLSSEDSKAYPNAYDKLYKKICLIEQRRKEWQYHIRINEGLVYNYDEQKLKTR